MRGAPAAQGPCDNMPVMLSFDTPHGQFNYRVAAVITRGPDVLLQVIGGQDFWCLPGGRVDFGESAEEAMRREIIEELGVEPRIERPLWFVENLYGQKPARYHEASLYYLASLPDSCPELQATAPWKTAELDGTPLLNQWHSVAGLESLNLLPSFLRTAVRDLPSTLEYVLHRDA
ncbi:MAG TPA: NUDIX domain-containing protein [Dehalococcoidia bacterium]|nr:NUDIX domain-containing protein [Dehalococcoidia bacterium]